MSEQSESLKMAESLAGRWFQTHSDQRLKLFNFYLVLFAGALTLLASNLSTRSGLLLIAVGLSLLTITFVFKRLDMRTSHLVKLAEGSLNKIEETLEEQLFPEVRLIRAASRTESWSYRQSFNLIYWLGATFSICAISSGVYFVIFE